MKIQQFKKYFFLELSDHYPETEIQSFFNLLVEFQLNLSRAEVILQASLEIKEYDLSFLQNSLSKLKSHIPIQYILGKTEFYGLDFKVNKHVLIPRPETEELVDWIVKDIPKNRNLKILDIGTGSGCIAISIAKNLPNAEVFAIDVSTEALQVAQKNMSLNKVAIHFIKADILSLKKLPYSFDIIVSNPPYVREMEKEKMQKNVFENEPHLALFVKDSNPLIFYDRISELAKDQLTKNGILYFEINQYLGEKTAALLKARGFKNIELKKDFFDNVRMIRASMH
jgi:release factor glutamine methyltransferase